MAALKYTLNDFENALREGKTVLVDYWAPWCSYCRRIGSAYEKIAQQYGEQIVVAKVNIDDEAQLAHQERIEVIPTLVLYKDGKAVASVVAPESKSAIQAFIEENLGK